MHPISRAASPDSTEARAAFAPAPPTRTVICSVRSVPPGGGRSLTGLITTSTCTQPITVIVGEFNVSSPRRSSPDWGSCPERKMVMQRSCLMDQFVLILTLFLRILFVKAYNLNASSQPRRR